MVNQWLGYNLATAKVLFWPYFTFIFTYSKMMQDFFFQILQVFYPFRDQMSYIINYAFQKKFSSFWIDSIVLMQIFWMIIQNWVWINAIRVFLIVWQILWSKSTLRKKCLPVKGHFQLGKNSPKVAHINMHSQKNQSYTFSHRYSVKDFCSEVNWVLHGFLLSWLPERLLY